MTFRITIAVVCWFSLAAASVACLNTYNGTDLQGRSVLTSDLPSGPIDRLRSARIDRTAWEQAEAELSEGLESADFKQRSDYAVALIYLGRYDEAISILEDVERQQPGEYIVATNLGTAYELNGNLDRALEWIQTGFERNPGAHAGSEWLHVKILEARLQLARDPDWLKTHTVLGLDLGRQPAPSLPDTDLVDSRGTSHGIHDIAGAIEYQLHERLQFVLPPDPVVADLLFDLGNLLSLTNIVERAIPVYEYAKEYGVQDSSLLDLRMDHLEALVAANPESGYVDEIELAMEEAMRGLAWFLAPLAFAVVAGIAYWRFARRNAARC